MLELLDCSMLRILRLKRGSYFLQGLVTILCILSSIASATDVVRAYVLNEDSHPHQVLPGDVARFSVETGKLVGLMDVKCSLEGDKGKSLTEVRLQTYGLIDVHWPFPGRTVQVDEKIDFDIIAYTQPQVEGLAYFEFINEDRSQILWHQCYNN